MREVTLQVAVPFAQPVGGLENGVTSPGSTSGNVSQSAHCSLRRLASGLAFSRLHLKKKIFF